MHKLIVLCVIGLCSKFKVVKIITVKASEISLSVRIFLQFFFRKARDSDEENVVAKHLHYVTLLIEALYSGKFGQACHSFSFFFLFFGPQLLYLIE